MFFGIVGVIPMLDFTPVVPMVVALCLGFALVTKTW